MAAFTIAISQRFQKVYFVMTRVLEQSLEA